MKNQQSQAVRLCAEGHGWCHRGRGGEATAGPKSTLRLVLSVSGHREECECEYPTDAAAATVDSDNDKKYTLTHTQKKKLNET